jgi:hypothetical protein
VGSQSHPARLTTSRNRVLRPRGDRRAKRTQGVRGQGDRASKDCSLREPTRSGTRKATPKGHVVGPGGPVGVEDPSTRTRAAQEPGRPLRLLRREPSGPAVTWTRLTSGARVRPVRAKTTLGRRYRKPRRRGRGTGGEESECPHSTGEAGEPSPAGPGGGKGKPRGGTGTQNRRRERWPAHRRRETSQRNKRG